MSWYKSAQAKAVIRKEKQIVETVDVCPHCNSEIGEKSLYSPDPTAGVYIHRPCQGKIEFPRGGASR